MPDQVIGDGVHPDFAFDHAGREAAQAIEREVGLDLTEVPFDLPAADGAFGDGGGGEGFYVEQGGDDDHTLGAVAAHLHSKTHEAHRQDFLTFFPGAFRLSARAVRLFPGFLTRAIAAGTQGAGLVPPNYQVDFPFQQLAEKKPAAKGAIGHQHLTGVQPTQQLARERQIVLLSSALDQRDQPAGMQIKQAEEFAGGKSAAFFLPARMGPALAVRVGIRPGETRAIGEPHGATEPLGFGPRFEPPRQRGELRLEPR